MLVHESKHYRIEEHRGLPKRFAVDRKEPVGDHVCLVNVGWCDWRHQAFQLMNEDSDTLARSPKHV